MISMIIYANFALFKKTSVISSMTHLFCLREILSQKLAKEKEAPLL